VREKLEEYYVVDSLEVGQVQEEILTIPTPLNSSIVGSPSSGRPNRSILKKTSTDSHGAGNDVIEAGIVDFM
jgi:hypothetical protein